MNSDSRSIRAFAREKLKGKWSIAVCVSLVAGLLGGIESGEGRMTAGGAVSLSPVAEVVIAAIGIILIAWAVAMFIIGPAINLGHSQFYLNLCRNKNVSFSVLFSKLSGFWKAFALNSVTVILTALWTLLLVIPGIIASYRYSMVMYILADNPEIGIMAAINESKRMMNGNKMRLFKLHLSFIGWAIVGTLTFGIGLLFLIPYISAASAAFYLEVSKEGTNV